MNPIASYLYTLDNAGHRTSVTEKSGRTVNYGCDSIYRLTSETISSDPNGINGAIGYSYDNVGNRLTQASNVNGISSGSFSYDPDDKISTGTFDANGNTLTTAGNPNINIYDFENHLVQHGPIMPETNSQSGSKIPGPAKALGPEEMGQRAMVVTSGFESDAAGMAAVSKESGEPREIP